MLCPQLAKMLSCPLSSFVILSQCNASASSRRVRAGEFLNHFVRNAERIEIACQSPAKSMPPMPLPSQLRCYDATGCPDEGASHGARRRKYRREGCANGSSDASPECYGLNEIPSRTLKSFAQCPTTRLCAEIARQQNISCCSGEIQKQSRSARIDSWIIWIA
jgi:hypothetical protein